MWGKAIARDNLTLFYTLFLSFGKPILGLPQVFHMKNDYSINVRFFLYTDWHGLLMTFLSHKFFFFFYWIIPQVISVWWKWNIFGNQKRNSSRINISLILLQWIIPQVLSVSSTQITPYVLLLKWWLSGRLLVQVYTPSPKSETQNLLVFSFDWNCET